MCCSRVWLAALSILLVNHEGDATNSLTAYLFCQTQFRFFFYALFSVSIWQQTRIEKLPSQHEICIHCIVNECVCVCWFFFGRYYVYLSRKKIHTFSYIRVNNLSINCKNDENWYELISYVWTTDRICAIYIQFLECTITN